MTGWIIDETERGVYRLHFLFRLQEDITVKVHSLAAYAPSADPLISSLAFSLRDFKSPFPTFDKYSW